MNTPDPGLKALFRRASYLFLFGAAILAATVYGNWYYGPKYNVCFDFPRELSTSFIIGALVIVLIDVFVSAHLKDSVKEEVQKTTVELLGAAKSSIKLYTMGNADPLIKEEMFQQVLERTVMYENFKVDITFNDGSIEGLPDKLVGTSRTTFSVMNIGEAETNWPVKMLFIDPKHPRDPSPCIVLSFCVVDKKSGKLIEKSPTKDMVFDENGEMRYEKDLKLASGQTCEVTWIKKIILSKVEDHTMAVVQPTRGGMTVSIQFPEKYKVTWVFNHPAGRTDRSREEILQGGKHHIAEVFGVLLPFQGITAGWCPAGDTATTGPAGDTTTTGPAGDTATTGPAGDTTTTGPEDSARTT